MLACKADARAALYLHLGNAVTRTVGRWLDVDLLYQRVIADADW